MWNFTMNGLWTEKSMEKAVTTQTFFRNTISRDRMFNNFRVKEGSQAYIFKTYGIMKYWSTLAL